jgi:hemerythrin-like metal-binding protein
MSVVHWSSNLSVGDVAIDSDHRDLIELLNRLAAEVEGQADHQAVAEGLDALIARAKEHFRHEQEIMDREGYPEAGRHRRLHEALIDEIQEFRKDFDGGKDIGPEITEFIKNWLVAHILESDKRFGAYMAGRSST